MDLQACSGDELLAWRRCQLALGGHAVDLDWLLDMEAELSWTELQRLRILPESTVMLACSFEALEHLWWRHLNDQVPLQHLVGRCPWRDLDLQISSAALIPRQETELLIDLALERLRDPTLAPCVRGERWADLGTGSGAMAVALARALKGWRGHAVDLSSEALELAQINLQRLAPAGEWQLHQGSWWLPLRPWWGQFDLVVSNPPYIPSRVVDELDPVVRDHEPRQALCGGEDGLDACREIIDLAPQVLAPGGWLLIEHHHDQSDQVLQLMHSSGLVASEARCDLRGVKRFAMARRAPSSSATFPSLE